jgi:predicted ATP-grasp superfamily ATP-dependent carboligase
VYSSNLENHPEAVRALAEGRALWGNAPDVLRRVRDPETLASALAARGIQFPQILTSALHAQPRPDIRWLIKPRASGGGHGVRFWASGEPVSRGQYLQEFIEGVPGSVVFVAAAGTGVVLGTSTQLIGGSAFGVSGFRYCGNILSVQPDTIASATTLVQALTDAFPLVGVGSIDFIATGAGLCPIEVNPRWTASMELLELTRDISVFRMHADACMRGVLPSFEPTRAPAATVVHGKAIVFSRDDVVVGDTREWLADTSVRDIPRAGERVGAGQPICTVFASGSDDTECHEKLVDRAERIYAQVSG